MQVLSEILEESCSEIRLSAQLKALTEAEECYKVDLTKAKRIVLDQFIRYVKREYNFA